MDRRAIPPVVSGFELLLSGGVRQLTALIKCQGDSALAFIRRRLSGDTFVRLPGDLLQHVASLLELKQQRRMRSVCRAWRAGLSVPLVRSERKLTSCDRLPRLTAKETEEIEKLDVQRCKVPGRERFPPLPNLRQLVGPHPGSPRLALTPHPRLELVFLNQTDLPDCRMDALRSVGLVLSSGELLARIAQRAPQLTRLALCAIHACNVSIERRTLPHLRALAVECVRDEEMNAPQDMNGSDDEDEQDRTSPIVRLDSVLDAQLTELYLHNASVVFTLDARLNHLTRLTGRHEGHDRRVKFTPHFPRSN